MIYLDLQVHILLATAFLETWSLLEYIQFFFVYAVFLLVILDFLPLFCFWNFFSFFLSSFLCFLLLIKNLLLCICLHAFITISKAMGKGIATIFKSKVYYSFLISFSRFLVIIV